jgi:2-polyprenyl-3-methyl-5-hydroxy-6-metoxy-1,4-benzoquinol methylase
VPDAAVAPVDLDDLNNPYTLAVLSIPPGSTVLDVGCGPGIVAKALAARGCRVWGIEIDPGRAKSARHHCVDVQEVDIEATALTDAFQGMKFDAVLFLDVLEHLRDPRAALAGATAVLAPGGRALISVPNVTHGALRLEMLQGRFRYRSSGLLDRGHLRFFDAESVTELIHESGFHAETRLRVLRRLDQTEFQIDVASIPSELRTELEGDADAMTYQFFVIARPARPVPSVPEAITLAERQQTCIHELSAALEEGSAYARHLEQELGARDGRLREAEVAAAADRIRLDQLGTALESRGADAAKLQVELDATTARLRKVEAMYEADQRELQAMDARLTGMAQMVADMKRTVDDGASYVEHLEADLLRRSGDIAIRDDELCVLRAHIEKTERAIRDRDAQLEHVAGSLRETAERAAQLTSLLAQPRHRLAERGNVALKRWMPAVHRLLRRMVKARHGDVGS